MLTLLSLSAAVCREVHTTRNNLRLVDCSVAACNTRAQGAQEGLSKVHLGLGGQCSGPRGRHCNHAPLLDRVLVRAQAPGCGVEVPNPPMSPETWTEEDRQPSLAVSD